MDALLVGLRPSAGQTLKKPLPILLACIRWRSGHHATKPMVLPWVMASGEKEALSYKKSGGIRRGSSRLITPLLRCLFSIKTSANHHNPSATKGHKIA